MDFGRLFKKHGVKTAPGTGLQPLSEAELEKVVGGAKDPSWRLSNLQGQNVDAANKAPYNPRAMEKLLSKDGQKVTSTTLPRENAKNVKLAGKKHPVTGVVFDERGFPIYDDVMKADLYLDRSVSVVRDRNLHFKNATKKLKTIIDSDPVLKNSFTSEQLNAINAGLPQVSGFTWHHHQDIGRMQLIPKEIHQKTGYVGGFELWFQKI